MSADIITRLRDSAPFSDDGELLRQAATEIEVLKKEVELLRKAVDRAYSDGYNTGSSHRRNG